MKNSWFGLIGFGDVKKRDQWSKKRLDVLTHLKDKVKHLKFEYDRQSKRKYAHDQYEHSLSQCLELVEQSTMRMEPLFSSM